MDGVSFWTRLRQTCGDVVLGTIGDWIDGPPGYFWASLQTALFLTICGLAVWAPGAPPNGLPTVGDRARGFLTNYGVLYVSFLGGTFALWLSAKVARRIVGGQAG